MKNIIKSKIVVLSSIYKYSIWGGKSVARTYIETLHLMNNLGNGVLIDDITEEDLVNITTALEKQIPMSRVIIEGQYFCPKCKNLMKYPGYCGCGQKVY